MTQQDKERIEREAADRLPLDPIYQDALDHISWEGFVNNLRFEYIAGATAELLRAQKEIAEKDKRIEELEEAIKTVIAYGYESDILQQALKPK